MFENFLVPTYVLIFLTFLVSFLHAYVSVKLTGPNQKWAKGIPLMPYPDAPENLKLIKNNIQNLFEFPVIFYVLCILCFIQGIQDQFLIILSWGYVVLRWVHSYLHLFAQNTLLRGSTFLLSNLMLFVMLLAMLKVMH
jgi:hypothetical protein|tara:strand:- start:1352 stop:1765 length:414 start_codon:yes stop_codon:yes gene_type:complete